MADCDDRQLTQAQREAAYSQQARAGVVRAIRPFSGNPTIPNIIDYLNRELVPAVKTQRAKLNDIYRPVVDNAPSGNPLSYYFSENTANGDPTTGFIRFDNATQELATTIRVSETNGRLANAAPWLDVMAGGATTPLGTVTVSDLGDPTRFIRFDLNTMTDQGAYWDLGVTPIESSHDNPFVDGGPVTIGFIPGVASTPVTVPVGSVTPMGAHTVLGNPTNATAAPTEIGMPVGMSLLGRKTTTGNIQEIRADEFVPAFFPDAGNLVPRMNNAGTTLSFAKLTTNSLVDVPEATMLIRNTNSTGPLLSQTLTAFAGLGLSPILFPNYNLNVNPSTSVVIDFPGTNEVQRAALTGDVTAAQNSNTTAFRSFTALSVLGRSAGTAGIPTEIAAVVSSEAVLHEALGSIAWGQVTTGGYADGSITDPKITNRTALSVWGRSANSSGPIADIAASAGSAAVLRESGSTIGWGTIATAGLADDSVTNAKLANMAARTFKGRADSAGTGDPQDLTGLQAGAIIRFDNGVADTTSSGSIATLTVAEGVNSYTFNGVTVTLHGINAPAERGQILWIRHIGAGSCSIVQESSSAGAATQRLALGDNITANTTGLILGSAGGTFNRSAMFMYTGSRWQRHDESIGEGFIVTQQLANNAVTDAKLRDSGALSVIGRSANSSGDPADISGSASSDAVLRISGTTLGFGQVATAGIADDAVTAAKMANMAERRIRGRADSAGTGDPQDLTGIQTGAIIRFGNQVTDAVTTGSVATLTVAAGTNQVTFNSVSPTIHGINVPTEIGQLLIIQHIGSGSTQFVHESSTAGAAGQRLRLGPYGTNTTALTLSQNQTALFTYDNRWVWIGSASSAYDADHGDITVTGGGVTWTIDNNVVSNAKLRDSGALSVIGRSANSSGDPADISATAASDQVLRESGSTLGFGTVATGGIANDAITDGKLRNSGACSVIGRSANSSGDPADISAGTNDRVFVRRSNALTFDQIVTGDIADGVITVAKLAGIGANTILGNDTAGTLTPNAISVGTNTVLGRVAGNIVAAQLATGQVADAAITLAKMANLAQSTIIGRAEGAGTGVPTALTPTQVVAIIDAESPTWTGSHTFSGTLFDVNTSSNVTIASGSTLTLAATSTVTVGSPFVVNNTTNLNGPVYNTAILSQSSSGPLSDVAIGQINVYRVNATANPTLLNGMVPTADGQRVLIVNTSTANTLRMTDNGSGTASNSFELNTTSLDILPLQVREVWYDGTLDRWLPIGYYV